MCLSRLGLLYIYKHSLDRVCVCVYLELEIVWICTYGKIPSHQLATKSSRSTLRDPAEAEAESPASTLTLVRRSPRARITETQI